MKKFDTLVEAIQGATALVVNGIDYDILSAVFEGEEKEVFLEGVEYPKEDVLMTFDELEEIHIAGGLQVYALQPVEISEKPSEELTMEQMLAFIGSEQDPKDTLLEILNGKYSAESFRSDVKNYE
ncbi:hypothetical protein AB4254_10980 [Vibrio breoganii]